MRKLSIKRFGLLLMVWSRFSPLILCAHRIGVVDWIIVAVAKGTVIAGIEQLWIFALEPAALSRFQIFLRSEIDSNSGCESLDMSAARTAFTRLMKATALALLFFSETFNVCPEMTDLSFSPSKYRTPLDVGGRGFLSQDQPLLLIDTDVLAPVL